MITLVERPRRGGKTYDMIHTWLQSPENTLLICRSEQEARRVRHEAEKILGAHPTPYLHHIMSMSKLPLRGYDHNMRVLVDNAESLFLELFRTTNVTLAVTQ